MNEMELIGRLLRAERRLRIVSLGAGILAVCVAGLGVWQACAFHRLAHPDSLVLRRLDIVDQSGVSRVILAAPAPEPMEMGKQHHRDGPVSGVIIADATGTERGGYVTADGYANAMLTLDAQGPQTALLLAEPNGNTYFRIWNRDNDAVTGSLTMGVSGNPFFNEKRDGNLVFSAPVNNPQSQDARAFFK
ncbi:MAG: hypothetical protein ABSG84_15690 [Acidobacteriaceae bacterium]|jgi:hypothetical protein